MVGRRVLTASGFGECVGYRASDATYEVKLSFGTSFVEAAGVQLAPEAPDMPPAPSTEEKEDGRKSPMPGAAPTADASTYPEPDQPDEALPETTQMLYGTQTLYVFLRLHEMLYQVGLIRQHINIFNWKSDSIRSACSPPHRAPPPR